MQVLVGMQFAKTNRVSDLVISKRTIWISRQGDVKIAKSIRENYDNCINRKYLDPTTRLVDGEEISANVSCLGALILTLLNETQEPIKSAACSTEAKDFVEAASWQTVDKLLEVIPKPLVRHQD